MAGNAFRYTDVDSKNGLQQDDKPKTKQDKSDLFVWPTPHFP